MAKAHLSSISVTMPDGDILVCSINCGELVDGLKLMSSPSVREVRFSIVDEEGRDGTLLFVKDSQRAIAVYAIPMALQDPKVYYDNLATRAKAAAMGGVMGCLEELRGDD
ncbi:MAG: hypothetical protein HYW79_00565 [Parcubacteria group bacterium]|nr:hypothetical protein [Parcubacteria group bacterium]